eukprot:CAMPEP_0203750860 /NCGR_PEP_ID=MMETSP0098-20131031/5016_1 /ASSEMBLY_ACC=CAM_ASM_000208 /TAXON_ID=96639 /ORGANISM=" , Strain NY0313808BC1" /LENGTH=402 /DNA_ID=CAMNT_0050640331 /DNA_START=294 /DNA_END=1499 /DNA_ORIENTATION=+
MPHRKKNACEACFSSRLKCTFSPGKDACERCIKRGMECVSRVILRGHASQLKKEETGLKRVQDDILTAFLFFKHSNNMVLSHNAANAIVRAYKGLGWSKAPPQVTGLINSFYLSAMHSKSMSKLHVTTSLAVSAGVKIDTHSLLGKPSPVTPQIRANLIAEISSRFLDKPGFGPCFVANMAGATSLLVSRGYSFFFEKEKALKKRADQMQAPEFELWRSVIQDPKDPVIEEFQSGMIGKFLKMKECEMDENGLTRREWDYKCANPTKVVDMNKNVYTASLQMNGLMYADGYEVYIVVSFQDMVPLDEGARQMCEEFLSGKKNVQQQQQPGFWAVQNDNLLLMPPAGGDNPVQGNVAESSALHSQSNNSSQQPTSIQDDPVWNRFQNNVRGLGGYSEMIQNGW